MRSFLVIGMVRGGSGGGCVFWEGLLLCCVLLSGGRDVGAGKLGDLDLDFRNFGRPFLYFTFAE